MIEIRSVLCPIDFSDHSRRAFAHAAAIARTYGAKITALHVFPNVPPVAYAGVVPAFLPIVLSDSDRECILSDLRQFVGSEDTSGLQIASDLLVGDPLVEILSEAASVDADLVVMGTHGRTGFDRLLLGSVTEKVLRKASCPVLTVPAAEPETVLALPVLFKHILCPVDFSEASMQALRYALSLAQEGDANLTILHVIPHEMFTFGGFDEGLSIAEYLFKREVDAERLMKEAIPESAGIYCRIQSLIVRGKPNSEIMRIASDRHADLIVMGVQGRGAVDLTLFGSTTHYVVRHAACPVMTIRLRAH